MAKEKKAQIIEHLQQTFGKSTVVVLTDYRGLPSAELMGLRRKMKESGNRLEVVKDTLARRALVQLERKEISALFNGPVAAVIGYGDVSQVPKMLSEHIRTAKSNLKIKSGFMGNRLLTAESVTILATLPSREVLLARVIGGMQSPIAAFVNVLSSPIQGFMAVLQARIAKMEAK